MWCSVEHAVKLHEQVENYNKHNKTPMLKVEDRVRICQANEEDNIELKV